MTIGVAGPPSGPSGPPRPYVRTDAIKAAIEGREADIVRAVGVSWPPPHGRTHINCPYPDHEDKDPSWRLMDDGAAICTCTEGHAHSVFDVVMKVLGVDFEEANPTSPIGSRF